MLNGLPLRVSGGDRVPAPVTPRPPPPTSASAGENIRIGGLVDAERLAVACEWRERTAGADHRATLAPHVDIGGSRFRAGHPGRQMEKERPGLLGAPPQHPRPP